MATASTGFNASTVARGHIRWVMERSGPSVEKGWVARFEGLTEENGELESHFFEELADAISWIDAEPAL